jgi:hypothetical protein
LRVHRNPTIHAINMMMHRCVKARVEFPIRWSLLVGMRRLIPVRSLRRWDRLKILLLWLSIGTVLVPVLTVMLWGLLMKHRL